MGEILLAICIFLLGIYYFKNPVTCDPILSFIGIFFILWIFTKAYLGYWLGGPLAFRSAALFYYVFFAFISYVVFERHLSGRWGPWFAGIFLAVNLLFVPMNDYFVIAYSFLYLGLSLSQSNLWLKYGGILLVGYHAIHSKYLWDGSRSHMIGIGVVSIFLTFYFLFGMIKLSWRTKVWAAIAFGMIGMIVLLTLGDRNAVKSMVNIRHLTEEYSDLETEINFKKKYYVERPLVVELYHENKDNQFDKIVSGEDKMVMDAVSRSSVTTSRTERKSVTNKVVSQPAALNQAVGSALLERANRIYEKAQAMTGEGDRSKACKTKTELKGDINYFLDNTNGAIPTEVQAALQGLSLALQHEKGRPVPETATTLSVIKLKESLQKSKETPVVLATPSSDRSLEIAYNNIFFRYFIWRDMAEELKKQKAWWGVDFGEPQRSPSLEILGWASIEWLRDGWIAPHNSFLHMIYRGGLIGFFVVLATLSALLSLTRRFLQLRSVWGGLLVAILLYWTTISNFLVFFELPYNAIPFWSFFGFVWAYAQVLEKDAETADSVKI